MSAGYRGYQPFLRALSHQFDDLSIEFGVEIYDQMMTDPEVAGTINLIKRAILSEGWSIEPSLPRDDPNYVFAVAMADFVRACLENLNTDPLVIFNELLDGIRLGSSCAEQTYRLCETGIYEGYLMLRDIKQKPNRSTVYVVDSFYNWVGILTARYPGQVYPAGSLVAVPVSPNGYIAGLLPRKKFIVFSWDVRENDPRGTSILRPAYSAWWTKQQIMSEYLSWASKFASPSLVGNTAQGAVAQVVTDASGDAVLDANGNPVTQTPEEVLAVSLQAFRNGSAIAVPFGSEIKAIETGNDGNAFAEAVRVMNTEIVKAVTMQLLATVEGKNQSRSASEVHQDVLGMLLLYVKQLFANTIRRDCFGPLLRYNFGDGIERYVPKLNLSHGTGFPPTPEQIANLMSAGYIDPTQFDELDKVLGLPRRTPQPVAAGAAPLSQPNQPQPTASLMGAGTPADGAQMQNVRQQLTNLNNHLQQAY